MFVLLKKQWEILDIINLFYIDFYYFILWRKQINYNIFRQKFALHDSLATLEFIFENRLKALKNVIEFEFMLPVIDTDMVGTE